MKKMIFLGLLLTQVAFAGQLPKQTLSLINGCTAEQYRCLTLSDQGGDGLSLVGSQKILQQLAAHIGEEVSVNGEMASESSFRVTSFTVAE